MTPAVAGGRSGAQLIHLAQLCHMIAGIAAATTTSAVAFIDTAHSFSFTRLLEMHETWMQRDPSRGYRTAEQMLENIHCFKAFTVTAVLKVLDSLAKELEEQVCAAGGSSACFSTLMFGRLAATSTSQALAVHSAGSHVACSGH